MSTQPVSPLRMRAPSPQTVDDVLARSILVAGGRLPPEAQPISDLAQDHFLGGRGD
jgi:hypothetical protein